MPAKKTRQQKKAGKAVYLLSADRKFRRLSLKKISERAKGARRRTRRPSIVKPAIAAEPPSTAAGHPAPARVASIAFVVAGLFLLATLVGASWSSPSVDAQVAHVQTEDTGLLTADVASAPAVPAKARTVPPVATVQPVSSAAPAPAAVTKAAMSRPTETARTRVEIAPADTQPAGPAESIDTVTISGCLDFDGKSAWLKDASGAEAVRARSWRSGFLKKRSSRIALVDGATSAEAYDGRRVSVTGVLVDREMHVSSLKPIADDCE